MVARFVRDEEAVGSNPATPTSICDYGVTKLFLDSGVPK